MKSNLTKLAAAGVVTLAATASAMAGSVTQQGESTGLAAGAPLPPGFYFVDTVDWGVRDVGAGGVNAPRNVGVGVNIPVLLWSTPWKVLGARLELAVAAPSVEVGVSGTLPGQPAFAGSYAESMYNPYIGGFLAWDLGGGWGASYGLGAYIGVRDTLADQASFLNNRFALSYTGGGWNLTANLIVGTALDTINPAFASLTNAPDYLNLDLTATKTFGRWEVGAIGFYSTDLDSVNQFAGYLKQSQFAVGALAGYDWGAIKTQVFVSRDVWEQNYGGFDTRVWGRVIVPLGDPFGGGPNMMYHK